jgi:DNA-binding transcriptional LysR family regulator
MHFNRLDLNLLVALDALLDERSITRAGERLNLSQSAMSGALARLRDYFGDELLVLVRRKMVPTPLAELLHPRVRAILLDIQTTLETRLEFDPATAQRHFRIIASDYVLAVLGVPTVTRLAKLAPNITCEFLAQYAQPTDLLERGEADFMIMPKPYLSPDHPSLKLYEDDYVCVVWKDNDRVGVSLSAEEYMALGHISTRFGNTQRLPSFEEWIVSNGGHARRLEVVTYDFNSAIQLVIGTQRVVTAHRRLAERHARFLPIRLVPLPVSLPMPRLAEHLQWNQYQDLDPANRWMRELLVSCAERPDD